MDQMIVRGVISANKDVADLCASCVTSANIAGGVQRNMLQTFHGTCLNVQLMLATSVVVANIITLDANAAAIKGRKLFISEECL